MVVFKNRWILLILLCFDSTVTVRAAHEVKPSIENGISYFALPNKIGGCFIIRKTRPTSQEVYIVGYRYSRSNKKYKKLGTGVLHEITEKIIKYDKPEAFGRRSEFRLCAYIIDPKTGKEIMLADISRFCKLYFITGTLCVSKNKKSDYAPFFFKRILSKGDWLKISGIIAAGTGAGVALVGTAGHYYNERRKREDEEQHENEGISINWGETFNLPYTIRRKFKGIADPVTTRTIKDLDRIANEQKWYRDQKSVWNEPGTEEERAAQLRAEWKNRFGPGSGVEHEYVEKYE